MTATPEGVAYLVEGVTLSPIPSSSVSFPGENLDHVGRTTTAPFASLPRWRRCLGCSCRWLSIALLGRIRFCACLCLVPLHRPGRVGRRLAVTLPLFCSGGCFAAVVVGWSSLRVDALPPLLIGRVDALPPWLGCGSSHLWRCSFFCRFSCWLVLGRPQVQLLVGAGSASIRVIVLEVFSPVLLLLLCVCFGCWVFVCVFSVFSLFLVLCDLVSVKRCLIASRIVCKLLLLNEIRAQARSRKTFIVTFSL